MIYLDEPLFFYSWNYNGGHTQFGGHYTETEFQERVKNERNDIEYTNIQRRMLAEGYLYELIDEQRYWKEFFVKKIR